jgi:hypothetical protein
MLTKKILLASLITILAAWAAPQAARAQAAIPTSAPTPTATPTPRPMVVTRTFHCSCSTGGQRVVWAGNVAASSYFQARQQAVGQCMGAIGAKPVSPLMPTPGASFGAGIPAPQPPMFNPCSTCACN